MHSLLSKDESFAIKGFLILLIVLGHNSFVCFTWKNYEVISPRFLWQFLYTFHVYCFLILPFFYNEKTYKKGNILKYSKRLLFPYLWVCAICFFISVVLLHYPFYGWKSLLKALVYGCERLLDENLHFSFPWFLPAMFTLMLLKDLFYSANNIIRIALIVLGIGLWLFVLISGIKFSSIGCRIPMAAVTAFRMLPICLLSKKIANHITDNTTYRLVFGGVFVFSLILFLLCKYNNVKVNLLFYFFMPVCSIILLFLLKTYLIRCKGLIYLGKLSFQVYLYHVFIYNLIIFVTRKFSIDPTILNGVIIYIITLLVSVILARLTTQIPMIKKILFLS